MGCQPNKQLDPNVQNRLRQYYNGQQHVQTQYDNATPYAFSNNSAAVPAYSPTTLQTPSYSNGNYGLANYSAVGLQGSLPTSSANYSAVGLQGSLPTSSANYSAVGLQGSVPAYSAGNYGYAPTQTAVVPNYSAGNYGYAPTQTAAVPTYTGANYATDNYAPTNYATDNYVPTNYAPTNYAPTNYAPTNYTPTNYAATSYVPQTFPTGNQVLQGYGNTTDLGYQTTLPTGFVQNYQGYGLDTNYNQYPQGQHQYVSGNNLQGTGLGLNNHTTVLDNKVNPSPVVELPKGN